MDKYKKGWNIEIIVKNLLERKMFLERNIAEFKQELTYVCSEINKFKEKTDGES